MKAAGVSIWLVLLGCTVALPADNWPSWRGTGGDGHAVAKAPPLKWSRTDNVRWKAPLPGPGNSSPVIWGQRVFLTQATEMGRKRSVLCFDRASGRQLWQRETRFVGKETTHETNPYCSATPVTDGERVIASLGSAGLVCYDFAGKELWRKDVGKLEHVWGNASSPILYGDLAILWCGPGERQFLLAVKKTSGETVWQRDEPGGKSGTAARFGGWRGSFSTPVVVRVGGHDELILFVPEKVKGFDPKTGKELWSCGGLGQLVYATPICTHDGIVVAISGFHGPALAVRAGGKGDVTESRRLWHHKQPNPQRIGSPLLVGDRAYLVNDLGIAECLEVKTGKSLWEKKRVGSAWGSPVLAAGRLYLSNNAGDTLVLSARPEYELLARNSLGEQVRSSLAIAGDEIFIRTHQHLWCIAAKK
jgi:outer membrane protein assembly factor BamB